jgi:hypothetical protein
VDKITWSARAEVPGAVQPAETHLRRDAQVEPGSGTRKIWLRRVRGLGLLRVDGLVTGQHGDELAALPLAGLCPLDGVDAVDE